MIKPRRIAPPLRWSLLLGEPGSLDRYRDQSLVEVRLGRTDSFPILDGKLYRAWVRLHPARFTEIEMAAEAIRTAQVDPAVVALGGQSGGIQISPLRRRFIRAVALSPPSASGYLARRGSSVRTHNA
jgi:hypothetical protein